jgi:capsular polysaccharide biosynthesis protein
MDSQPSNASPRRSIPWLRVAQFFAAWVVQVVVLELLVFFLMRTTYTATALLICRESPNVFGGEESSTTRRTNLERYLSTQAELVTSSDVLAAALVKHPEMVTLPSLKGVEDPEAELRRLLNVQIRPNTNLITVSVPSENSIEAKQIVDNVVDSYLAAAHTWADHESRDQIVRLTRETQRLENDINAKRTKLKNLQDRIGTVNPEDLRDQGRMSMERFQKQLDRLDDIRFERMRLESEVEVGRLYLRRGSDAVGTRHPIQDAVASGFYGNPHVAELVKSKQEARKKLDEALRESKREDDPGVAAAKKRVDEIDAQIAAAWKELAPKLFEPTAHESDEERHFEQLEAKLRVAQTMEAALQDRLRSFQVDNTRHGSQALEVDFARKELQKDEQLLGLIRDRILQLEYDARGPARMERASHATRVDPMRHHRIGLMLAMPAVALLIVLPAFPLALHVFRRRQDDPAERQNDDAHGASDSLN